MKIKPIKTKKQYEDYLNWVDEQFDKRVKPDTPAGDTLQVVLLRIKHYEDKHYPIPKPNAVETIKLKMKELGVFVKTLLS